MSVRPAVREVRPQVLRDKPATEMSMRFGLFAALLAFFIAGPAMSQEKISISSDWGGVTAELTDNEATRALVKLLPLTVQMTDHLRQEKTGALPTSLPDAPRQRDFEAGTLGLWSSTDFVIYYTSGRVPSPGIVVLGKVTGDVAIFNRQGPVTVRIQSEK
jgi:hypothetical protein